MDELKTGVSGTGATDGQDNGRQLESEIERERERESSRSQHRGMYKSGRVDSVNRMSRLFGA